MLQDKYLPDFHFKTSHSITIAASPSKVAEVLAGMDFSGSRLIRFLFRMRGLPTQSTHGIEGLKQMGFTVLEHHPGREIIFGLAGQFWKLRGNIQTCAPDEFISFFRPEFVKAIWNFKIERINENTSALSTETRIACTDKVAYRKFARYWFFVRPFSGVIRMEMLRSIKHSAEANSIKTLRSTSALLSLF